MDKPCKDRTSSRSPQRYSTKRLGALPRDWGLLLDQGNLPSPFLLGLDTKKDHPMLLSALFKSNIEFIPDMVEWVLRKEVVFINSVLLEWIILTCICVVLYSGQVSLNVHLHPH